LKYQKPLKKFFHSEMNFIRDAERPPSTFAADLTRTNLRGGGGGYPKAACRGVFLCHLFVLFGYLCGDMINTRAICVERESDAELVRASLAGKCDAFGQIVAQYQSLICSLAYSATGSLSQSEDLAQETFVTAWKELRTLREPSLLQAWLCGIARCLIGKALRRQGREPAHAAESLDTTDAAPALDPLPPEQAISKEEEAILWRSLERITAPR
jgi:RNA polymerase sigma factor (sigma-70 family)